MSEPADFLPPWVALRNAIARGHIQHIRPFYAGPSRGRSPCDPDPRPFQRRPCELLEAMRAEESHRRSEQLKAARRRNQGAYATV